MYDFGHLKIAEGLRFQFIGDFIKFEDVNKISKVLCLYNTVEIPYSDHYLLKISSQLHHILLYLSLIALILDNSLQLMDLVPCELLIEILSDFGEGIGGFWGLSEGLAIVTDIFEFFEVRDDLALAQ